MQTSRPFHHGDLKEAVLRSAVQLVERVGAENFSLREVAREAGVSSAAPYRHYPAKDALLAEVAQQGFERLHAGLVAAGAGLERRQAFLAQCVAYVRFAQHAPGMYRLMFGELPDKHRYQGLAAAGGRLFALLDEAVASAGGEHPFRAVGCWAFIHGLAMLALDDQLKVHLPGTDDADLLAVIRPLAEAFA